MSRIVLCPDSTEGRARYLAGKQIPEKYMEDFTLMGFVVDKYQDAVALMKNAGFSVDEYDGGSEIDVTGPAHLVEIQSLFTAHRIKNDFSDIADTIYQA